MIQAYAIIDVASGQVENIAVWDGVSQWSPGEGKIARVATPSDRNAYDERMS